MVRRVQPLGQAATLSGRLWPAWRKHLHEKAPMWVFVAVTLSHILCLRISEVLALKATHFNWQHRYVKIKPLKRQPEAMASQTQHDVF